MPYWPIDHGFRHTSTTHALDDLMAGDIHGTNAVSICKISTEYPG
ncbi:hypothetical protein [Candidatus Brachybacter algidus]|nr:hypothetical protein [Candidatus Brachybacter algidus]